MFKQLEKTHVFITPSGMKVTILYKPDFKQQSMIIGVPFGGIHSNVYDDHHELYQPGLAHFLEHKLFESESGDIMAQFSELGAQVNAFTSYQETCYYFNTTTKFKESSNLLLDLVSDCSLSEESVEKEKGIIISELSMYEAMVDQALVKNLYKSLYHNHPIIHDIGGSKKSVTDITLNQLMDAFHRFYHPSLMQCVCVTNEPIESVEAMILAHPLSSRIKEKKRVTEEAIIEPHDVAFKDIHVTMDIEVAKGVYALKLDAHEGSSMNNVLKQFALRFLLEATFSELNPLYQEWIDQELINDYFDMDVDVSQNYSYIAFLCEHEHLDEVFDWIESMLKKVDLDEITLNQLKRRYLGMSLKALNKPSSLSKQLIRYALNDLDFFDVLGLFQTMSMKDIDLAKQHILNALSHSSRVKITPQAK
jgi:predicted Zn-dependent peptidase